MSLRECREPGSIGERRHLKGRGALQQSELAHLLVFIIPGNGSLLVRHILYGYQTNDQWNPAHHRNCNRRGWEYEGNATSSQAISVTASNTASALALGVSSDRRGERVLASDIGVRYLRD